MAQNVSNALLKQKPLAAPGEDPLHYSARIDLLQQQAAGQISPLGVASLPAEPILLKTNPSAKFDWVFMSLQQDPSFVNGTLAIPHQVKSHLRQLDDAGVAFDELLIGYEIDKTLSSKLDVRKREDLTELVRPKPGSSKPLAGASALQKSMRTALRVAGRVASVPGALIELMDPVLIGAVTADGTRAPGTPAALFLIARWT